MAVYSIGWLVAANVVGVWLAVCLVWPGVGNLLAPFTYGRWTPLHLDWQLYGWCSLPIVGALFMWCIDLRHPHARRHAQLALGAWSVALAAGGIAWLGGTVSGKLFLDWHGWTRPLLPLAMYVLWAILALHTRWRWAGLSFFERASRVLVLGLLVIVPSVLFWSTGRNMYQSVNPDSGGATGPAVLGSTLGIVTIFMLAPTFLGVRPNRRITPFAFALLISWLVFATIERGNVSHHATVQIVALGLLLLWIPLLPLFWRRHDWPAAARPWLLAATVWWTILVVTGWISFLPGFSEALKFTHALVGHAHLAMAGLITSVNAAIVVVVSGRAAPRSVFWLWQGGCAVYIISMYVLGGAEVYRAAEFFRGELWTQGLLGVRLASGVAMTVGSIHWLAQFFCQTKASARLQAARGSLDG